MELSGRVWTENTPPKEGRDTRLPARGEFWVFYLIPQTACVFHGTDLPEDFHYNQSVVPSKYTQASDRFGGNSWLNIIYNDAYFPVPFGEPSLIKIQTGKTRCFSRTLCLALPANFLKGAAPKEI
jgi:hypothetical protein